MLYLPCPWCGDRDETEFRYGGEAGVAHPAEPDALNDAAWSEYLFVRRNPKGWFRERWVHTAGCRQWFTVDRHTVTYRTRDPRPLGGPNGRPTGPRAEAAVGGGAEAGAGPRGEAGAGGHTEAQAGGRDEAQRGGRA